MATTWCYACWIHHNPVTAFAAVLYDSLFEGLPGVQQGQSGGKRSTCGRCSVRISVRTPAALAEVFLIFFVLPAKFWDSTSIRPGPFPSKSFHFIIHQSSYNSTPCSLRTDNVLKYATVLLVARYESKLWGVHARKAAETGVTARFLLVYSAVSTKHCAVVGAVWTRSTACISFVYRDSASQPSQFLPQAFSRHFHIFSV
jgi:hypothetical protein